MHHADSSGLVKMINTITIFRMMEPKTVLRPLPLGPHDPNLVSCCQLGTVYGRSLSLRLGGGSFKVELGPGPLNHDPQNRSTLNDLARTVCKIVQP